MIDIGTHLVMVNISVPKNNVANLGDVVMLILLEKIIGIAKI